MPYVPFGGVSQEQIDDNKPKSLWRRTKENISDIASTVVSDAKNLYNSTEQLADENPLALTGTPMQDNITNAPAPEQTPEQQQAYQETREAGSQFYNDVIRTPLEAGAFVPGPVGTVSQILLAPEFINAGATAFEEAGGGWEGAKNAASTLNPFGGAYDLITDENKRSETWQNIQDRPLSGTVSAILDVAPAIAIGAGVAYAGRGLARSARERYNRAIEEPITPELPTSRSPYEESAISEPLRNVIEENRKSFADRMPDENTIPDSLKETASEQPWRVTREEFERAEPKRAATGDAVVPHETIVEDAIKAGEAIPRGVLAEYPDLAQKYAGKINVDESGYLGGNTIAPAASTLQAPVTRAEIVNDINNLVVARTGRIGNSAFAGIIKNKPEVIRARNYGDFDAYAHEIGHYIDNKLQIKGHDAELIAAADKEWSGNKTYDKYTTEEKRAEGIAEFGRQYLLNPTEAQKNFPGYSKAFQDGLNNQPQMAKTLNTIGDKMRKWYTQTEEARVGGSITYGDEDYNTVAEKARDAAYKTYDVLVNDKTGLLRVSKELERQAGRKMEFEENPYLRARMAQGEATGRAEMLINDNDAGLVQAVLNDFYGVKLKYAVTMKSVLAEIEPKTMNALYPQYLKEGGFKNWRRALGAYLMAKRQIELQSINPKYKGPVTKVDAEATVKNAPPEIAKAAEKFYQYNDNLLSIQEAGGLISKEMADGLREKYKNYAPMSRDFSDEAALSNAYAGGKGIGNVGTILKKLTEEGSARNVIDPVASTMKNTQILLNAVERNRVGQSFVKYAEEPGMGKFIEKVEGDTADPKKSIFTVMKDGEKQAYQTTPDIYQAIMTMNETNSNILINIASAIAKGLRTGATSMPPFIIANMIKDTIVAGVFSKHGFIPIVDTLRGAYSLLADKELTAKFKATGVPFSTLVGLDKKSLSRNADALINDKGWRNAKPIQIAEAIFEVARKSSEFAESSTRMGEFRRAVKAGKSAEEAGFAAKEITLDFSRGGSAGRKYNRIDAFFNAVIQGTDKVAKELKNDFGGTVLRASLYIALPSIALWLTNHDQEWYKELPETEKNAYWYVNQNIRIPKPELMGMLFGSGVERSLDSLVDGNSEFKEYFKSIAGNIVPNLVPNLFTAWDEWRSGYSFFFDKPIVGRKEQGLPDALQYNDNTTEVAKMMGKLFDLSPEKIDNLISNLSGTGGRFVVGLPDSFIKDDQPTKGISSTPVVGRFLREPFKNPKSVETFYSNLDELEKNHTAYGKKGSPENNLKTMRIASEQLRDLHKSNIDIAHNNDLDPDTKRQRIDANNAKILSITQKANAKIGKQAYK